jgi:hypothetical protein
MFGYASGTRHPGSELMSEISRVGMKIHIATAGSAPYHETQKREIQALAGRCDDDVYVLEPDPEAADVVLFVDLHQHPGDPFLRVFRRHELVRAYDQKVCVLDLRDRPFYVAPGVYVSGSRTAARRRRMVGGPYPALPHAGERASRDPRRPSLVGS